MVLVTFLRWLVCGITTASRPLPPLSLPDIHNVWSPEISPPGLSRSSLYTFSPKRVSYKTLLDHLLVSNETVPHTETLIDFLDGSHTVAEDLRHLSERNVYQNWREYRGYDIIRFAKFQWLDDDGNRMQSSLLLKSVLIFVTAMNTENPSEFSQSVGFTDVCEHHRVRIFRMMEEAMGMNERRRTSRRMGVRSIHAESNIFASKMHAFCPNQFGDFHSRQLILKIRIANEQYEDLNYRGRANSARRSWTFHGKFGIVTSREHVFDTAVSLLGDQQVVLLHGVHITFEDELGEDHGGVTRDWITELVEQIQQRFFAVENDYDVIGLNQNETVPIPTAYQVIGNILGVAFLEGIGTGLRFPLAYMGFILDQSIDLEDIAPEDPQLYQTLRWTMSASAGELEGITLEVPSEYSTKVVDVTLDNRKELIRQKLNAISRSDFQPLVSIKAGFYAVIPPSVFIDNIVTPMELRDALEGETKIDVFDMWLHIDLLGYEPASPQVIWLWEAMTDEGLFTPSRLTLFLRFLTGLRQLPRGGFPKLDRRITIARFARDDAHMALPSAHTCVYQLNLPEYTSKENLVGKLVYAIEASPQMGFV